MATVHVVGAGLAGLSCALTLAESGVRVVVHEAAPAAGGRCRSFADAALGRMVDNGSHLMLSGNRAVIRHLERTGARDRMTALHPAAFPFLDRATGQCWTLRPGGMWFLDPSRRVPGGGALDHFAALRLLTAPAGATVADVLRPGSPLYARLWAPLAVAGLNGRPERVSARLLGAILRETLLRGEAACRPLFAPDGLSAALVTPALARLEALGAEVRFNARVEGPETADGRVTGFRSGGAAVAAGADDALVLAVPPRAAARLLPGLTVPPPGPAIVNAHFRLDRPAALPGGLPFLGLIGGTAEWLFARGDVLSVTVSAADALAERPAETVAAALWTDCAAVLGRPADAPVPPVRVVKERRATFDQSPTGDAARPPAATRLENLVLAGDWTATGLPATVEGALRSGEAAALVLLGRRTTSSARPGLFQGFTFPGRRHM
ncbi:hydroxysqualene dehydroxylase HpnE [Azospirillum halopraeferens]|uniref:hydroxysqualene dehydroxylase HpnE n=1 Tax=Azospirillum halopraeferens TaxID=34010 RepID=UPI000427E1DA|nr:hydroxysqualene dehydroxylase HpnE [Azospirillum halopraeferens]